jgi:hypothetical protein
MTTRFAAVLGLAAMLALSACSTATPGASQSGGNQAAASGNPASGNPASSNPASGNPASGNLPAKSAAAANSCTAPRPDDAQMFTLVPETISVSNEPVVLKRQVDTTPKTQASLDSLAHGLPGIDVSTLNCLRWAVGSGFSPKGYQTTIQVYLAPDPSGVSGADLAAAAERRWTNSTQFTCQARGAGALAEFDCEGFFIAHASSGNAGIEIVSGDVAANVVAIAQQIAAGI